jgi:hypothetical protein
LRDGQRSGLMTLSWSRRGRSLPQLLSAPCCPGKICETASGGSTLPIINGRA